MAAWQIRHFTHGGDLLHTFNPENLHFTLNSNDAHDISYEISLDNPINDEKNTDEGDAFGAYQTDWRLLRDGTIVQDMAGMITGIHISEKEDKVEVNGKSWMHYLDRRHLPFDRPADVHSIKQITFTAFDTDVASIIHDMIQSTCARPYSLDIDVSDLVGMTTFSENFKIEYLDLESILSKIKTLAEGHPGFDFRIGWQKDFHLYYPEFADPTDPEFIMVTAEPPTQKHTDAAYETDWTDNGPQGTHLIAQGSGLSFREMWPLGSEDGQKTFRRLDFDEDFGDVSSPAKLRRLGDGALRAGVRPQREVPIKIIPEQIHDFWTRVKPGCYFVSNTELGGGHTVTGTKKLVQIDCQVTNEGEELVELHSELWKAWYDVDTTVVQK